MSLFKHTPGKQCDTCEGFCLVPLAADVAVSPFAFDLLAEYLTGPEVGNHSIGLQMPLGTLANKRAERFFALRAAFGIRGYDDQAAATKAITAAVAQLAITAIDAARGGR